MSIVSVVRDAVKPKAKPGEPGYERTPDDSMTPKGMEYESKVMLAAATTSRSPADNRLSDPSSEWYYASVSKPKDGLPDEAKDKQSPHPRSSQTTTPRNSP